MAKYRKTVVLRHLGTWYHVYDDDAIVISNITQYKLFNDIKTEKLAVGFPDISIEKVISDLELYKINYILIYDDNILHDFGENNAYDKFVEGNVILPGMEHIRSDRIAEGSFVVQYNNEPEETYTIGENISQDAKLVVEAIKHDIGDIFDIGDDKVRIVSKNIKIT